MLIENLDLSRYYAVKIPGKGVVYTKIIGISARKNRPSAQVGPKLWVPIRDILYPLKRGFVPQGRESNGER